MSQDTAIRYVAMLTAMLVGRWMSTSAINERLVNRGFQVSERTIQRDLWKLAAQFGLEEMVVGAKKKVWRRTRDLEQMYGSRVGRDGRPISQVGVDRALPGG